MLETQGKGIIYGDWKMKALNVMQYNVLYTTQKY